MSGYSYDDYARQFEKFAGDELKKYSSMSCCELLLEVRDNKYGHHYQIWKVIVTKCRFKDAGWVLFDVLNQELSDGYGYVEWLNRSHCAEALLKLSGGYVPQKRYPGMFAGPLPGKATPEGMEALRNDLTELRLFLGQSLGRQRRMPVRCIVQNLCKKIKPLFRKRFSFA